MGAVLEIQSKEREWTTDTPSGEPELVYDWTACGSTGVELDTGTGTTVPITKAHHIVEMLFHYIDDMGSARPDNIPRSTLRCRCRFGWEHI